MNPSLLTLPSPRFLLLAIIAMSGTGITLSPAQSWTPTSAPALHWTDVASSTDSTKLVAVSDDFPGAVYVSSDSGANWTPAAIASGAWTTVACSSDGTRLIVAGNDPSVGIGSLSRRRPRSMPHLAALIPFQMPATSRPRG